VANPLDVTAATTGSNATPDSDAVTTTSANELLFGANMVVTGTTTAGTDDGRGHRRGPGRGSNRVVPGHGVAVARGPVDYAADGVQCGSDAAANPPDELTATATSSMQVSLSWTASTSPIGVAGCLVERCQGTGCTNFSQRGASTATTGTDSGLLPSTRYSYRVRVKGRSGDLGRLLQHGRRHDAARYPVLDGAGEPGGFGRQQLADQPLVDGFFGERGR
jgi:hypothetical protein